MRTPKMLPWLARKAKISDAHAEELWAEALDYAAAMPCEPRPGARDELAVKRLLMLIEAEVQAINTSCEQNRQSRRPCPVTKTPATRPQAEDMLTLAAVS